MRNAGNPTRLLPQQTRLINANEGLRLRVVCGRLWLTQPNAVQDLFLGPGDCVDLRQDWVVIGADAQPSTGGPAASHYSAYELHPLAAPQPGFGPLRAVLAKLCAMPAAPWRPDRSS